MLGYTNLDSEKGFAFSKIPQRYRYIDELENAGIQEGGLFVCTDFHSLIIINKTTSRRRKQ